MAEPYVELTVTNVQAPGDLQEGTRPERRGREHLVGRVPLVSSFPVLVAGFPTGGKPPAAEARRFPRWLSRGA